jgi:hypothetical protein
MRADIFLAGVATAIAKKSSDRVCAAWLQFGAKNVDFFFFYYCHS